MKWKASDLENLKTNLKPNKVNPVKMPNIEKVSVEKNYIEMVLFVMHRECKIPEYVKELKFDTERRWKADWAIPELKTLIEYEGLISKKSRHTTISGYSNDTIKYNKAAILGWKVLRYTALTYKNIENDLNKIRLLKSK